MKTFKDLEFTEHPYTFGFDTQAAINFENHYGVSVITGKNAYSSDTEPYEVAVLYQGELCFLTPITDDCIGYQTEEGVTDIMLKVQQLKN